MKRCCLAVAVLALLSPAVQANWICGPMDPYPGYGHPSFYFPPAVADFYAGYGYPSLIPGTDYYTATGADHHHLYPYYAPHFDTHAPNPWPFGLVPQDWTITMPGMELQR